MTESYWRNKNVFVTGCTGLLGSWLTSRLVEEGAHVVGLVRDIVPRSHLNSSGFAARIDLVMGSVSDYDLVLRALNEYEIDTCFHLAAQTIVTIANRSPMSTFDSNIRGTWTVLEALRHTPTIQRIVVASSDKAYGDQKELPYLEDAPLRGLHPYDVSKTCADLLAQT
ncbi:MAG: GDP-mannose 4,6-dehydratase, partial [bacterium]